MNSHVALPVEQLRHDQSDIERHHDTSLPLSLGLSSADDRPQTASLLVGRARQGCGKPSWMRTLSPKSQLCGLPALAGIQAGIEVGTVMMAPQSLKPSDKWS